MNRNLTVLAAIGAALSMSNVEMVAAASGKVTVSATASEACSVCAATMTFPPVSPKAFTDVVADTAGSLLIACTALITPFIRVDSPRILSGSGAGVVELPLLAMSP